MNPTPIVIVAGNPRSGKNTVASYIAGRYGGVPVEHTEIHGSLDLLFTGGINLVVTIAESLRDILEVKLLGGAVLRVAKRNTVESIHIPEHICDATVHNNYDIPSLQAQIDRFVERTFWGLKPVQRFAAPTSEI